MNLMPTTAQQSIAQLPANLAQNCDLAVFSGIARPGLAPDLKAMTPIYWAGDQASVIGLTKPGPHDTVVQLKSEPTNGTSAWLVIRPREDSPSVPALVVEDNSSNRAYYTEALSQLGLDVHSAASGAEAAAIARTHDLRMAVLDIRLPDTNGFELCRSLLSDFGLHDCVVLLMSADPKLADAPEVREVGARGFIVNPISIGDLQDRVRGVMAEAAVKLEAPKIITSADPLAEAELRLLGPPRVELAGKETRIPAGRSSEVVACLAATCPAPIPAERLLRFAWHADGDVSVNAVYTGISRLRSQLGRHGLSDLILSDDLGYRLNLDVDNIDIVAFERDARNLLAEDDPDPDQVRQLLVRWGAGPLVGLQNEVVDRWRNRLKETRGRLLEALARTLLRRGQADESLDPTRDLLADEPWREGAWAQMIVALYRLGRTNDALRAFSDARERLQVNLGLDPGPRLAELELMILTHDPALNDDAIFE